MAEWHSDQDTPMPSTTLTVTVTVTVIVIVTSALSRRFALLFSLLVNSD